MVSVPLGGSLRGNVFVPSLRDPVVSSLFPEVLKAQSPPVRFFFISVQFMAPRMQADKLFWKQRFRKAPKRDREGNRQAWEAGATVCGIAVPCGWHCMTRSLGFSSVE